MTEAEQRAYEEMTDAAKVVVEQIRRHPFLLDRLCQEVEIALITIVLKRSGGNCTRAAKLLGINRTTLVEKRRKYKMELKQLSRASL